MFLEAGGSVSGLQRQSNADNYLPRTQSSSPPRGNGSSFLENYHL